MVARPRVGLALVLVLAAALRRWQLYDLHPEAGLLPASEKEKT